MFLLNHLEPEFGERLETVSKVEPLETACFHTVSSLWEQQTASCPTSSATFHYTPALICSVSLSLPLLQLWGEDDKLDVLEQILPIPSGLCHSSCLKSCFLAQPEHCNKWGESLSNRGWCQRGLWKQSLVLGSGGCFRQNKYKCCHLTDLFPLSLFHSSQFVLLWANQAMHSSLVTVTHLGHPRGVTMQIFH